MTPTDYVIFLVPAVLMIWGIYDLGIVLMWQKRYGWPTITQRVIQLSKKYPYIPVVVIVFTLFLFWHFWG